MGGTSRLRAEEKRRRKLVAAQMAAASAARAADAFASAKMSRFKRFSKKVKEYRVAILKALPLGVFLPMALFLGSVGPDDFSRNYAAWARTFGLTDLAEYLGIYATGSRVFWGTILISFVYVAIAFVIPALMKSLQRDRAVVAVPISVALIVAVAVYGQYAISYPAERHISEHQRAKLKEILSPIASDFPRALAVAAVNDPEANAYAIELMTALALTGIKVVSTDTHILVPTIIRALTPNVRGVFFQVRDPKNPPQEVKQLADAMNEAGIAVNFYNNVDFPDTDYALSVGLK